MTEVTQEDRERAWPFRPDCYDDDTMTKMAWHSGQYDHTRIIQAFAQRRINTRPASTEPADALAEAREALDQALDDMGDDGKCVCQATKNEMIAALSRLNEGEVK